MPVNKTVGKRILAALLAAGFVVGCAVPADSQHAGHHAGAQGGMAGTATTQSAPCCAMMGGQGGMRPQDREAMCAMYRGMRDAPDEQARQAMMQRHMQAMTPEMRQRHMEMMRQQCQ